MMRVFLQDSGRYRRGEVHDWPKGTWQGISPRWEQISKPVQEVLDKRLTEAELAEIDEAEPVIRRGPGRPRKVPIEE